MRKRLSSSSTIFFKYVFICLAAGFLVFSLFIDNHLESDTSSIPMMLIPFTLLFLLHFSVLRKLKNVHIDDEFLYVSNFRKKVKTPIANILDVYDLKILTPRFITINFKEETEFGKSIIFIGYSYFTLPFATHQCVKEIRKRMKIQDHETE